eukprot:gene9929-15340_t
MGRRATAHLPLLPQIGEQVTHRQPLAHVLRAELLASWVERSHAILHQAVGQRHIAADHQSSAASGPLGTTINFTHEKLGLIWLCPATSTTSNWRLRANFTT